METRVCGMCPVSFVSDMSIRFGEVMIAIHEFVGYELQATNVCMLH